MYHFGTVFEGEGGFSAEEYDLQKFMFGADLTKKCHNFGIDPVPLYMELAIYIEGGPKKSIRFLFGVMQLSMLYAP